MSNSYLSVLQHCACQRLTQNDTPALGGGSVDQVAGPSIRDALKLRRSARPGNEGWRRDGFAGHMATSNRLHHNME